MKSVLITGSSGLIGTALCEKFAQNGWEVYGVDKYLRGKLLKSKDADTKGQIEILQEKYSNITQYEYDIREYDKMKEIIKDVDAIIHGAAQVSHPQSLKIPVEDADINIMGTLNLLEITRQINEEIPFAFISTNKVYGDYPNYFNYEIINNDIYKRYENCLYDSFNEDLPIDHCGHTPFGVSKTAADLYTQEYAYNYGMITTTFRGGCLIGKNQRAVEVHGFLGFFTKQILLKNKINIYGGGYRVRDNIHSTDVADVIYLWINNPKPNSFGKYGTPYNLGGMRENSISIFETMDAIKAKTGIEPIYTDAPPRESDHLWWISDMSKFKKDYPEWKGPTKSLDYILNELINHWIQVYNINIELQKEDFLEKLRK